MATKNVRDLLSRFAAEESRFLDGEFLAPQIPGAKVCVRIAGAVCTLRAQPAGFEGWGVFCPTSFREAHLVRVATLAERKRYLSRLPQLRLIVGTRRGSQWFAYKANSSRNKIDDGAVAED